MPENKEDPMPSGYEFLFKVWWMVVRKIDQVQQFEKALLEAERLQAANKK